MSSFWERGPAVTSTNAAGVGPTSSKETPISASTSALLCGDRSKVGSPVVICPTICLDSVTILLRALLSSAEIALICVMCDDKLGTECVSIEQ